VSMPAGTASVAHVVASELCAWLAHGVETRLARPYIINSGRHHLKGTFLKPEQQFAGIKLRVHVWNRKQHSPYQIKQRSIDAV